MMQLCKKGPFRIQYASDLHLELMPTLPDFSTLLKPAAQYLALAGDIGHFKQWKALLDWASPQWRRIFFVTGNHEYYNIKDGERETIAERDGGYAWLAGTYPNVHFLHTKAPSVFIPHKNVAIVGSTLWSQVDPAAFQGTPLINDFHRIWWSPTEKLTPQSANWMHAENRWALELEIDKWANRGANICVMTHHMPSFRLVDPRYTDSPYNSCFASKCDDLIRYPVRTWIYGHTHSAANIRLGKNKDVMCCVNARGYQLSSGKAEVPGFMARAFTDINCHDAAEIEEQIKAPLTLLSAPKEEEVEFM